MRTNYLIPCRQALGVVLSSSFITFQLPAQSRPQPELTYLFAQETLAIYSTFRTNGHFTLDFSFDLKNWYVLETYEVVVNNATFSFSETMSPKGFYRVSDVTESPLARDVWYRAKDNANYGLRRFYTETGSTAQDILELRNLTDGTTREVGRVQSPYAFLAPQFDVSADGNYVAYGILKGTNIPASAVFDTITNQVVLQSLQDPARKFQMAGKIFDVREDHSVGYPDRFMFVVDRPFYRDSGLIARNYRYVTMSEFKEELNSVDLVSETTNAVVSVDRYSDFLAASIKSVTNLNQGGAPYQDLISIYDISKGLDPADPTLLYEFRVGESMENMPRWSVSKFFHAQDQGYVILIDNTNNGLLVDPIGKRTLPLNTNAWNYVAFQDHASRTRIVGDTTKSGTVTYIFDPALFTLTPFVKAATPLVVTDMDGASLVTGYTWSDDAYQFMGAIGAGFNGGDALLITYNKNGFPYAHGAIYVDPTVVDFSSYSRLKMKVKNAGTATQKLTLKFEANSPSNSFEETFSIPQGSEWVDVDFVFPDWAAYQYVLAASTRLVIFCDVGQSNTEGSFLLDNIVLEP